MIREAHDEELGAVDGLTPRESRVAFWLAHGKTNREIGLILKMASRTVEKHVEHILSKLGVENRVAAALHLRRPDDRLPQDRAPRLAVTLQEGIEQSIGSNPVALDASLNPLLT